MCVNHSWKTIQKLAKDRHLWKFYVATDYTCQWAWEDRSYWKVAS